MRIRYDKVTDALYEYIDAVGAENALGSITKAMPTDELREILEFIFRVEDFQPSYSFLEDSEEEEK